MNRDPGVYPALPMDDYLATHAVSASILRAMEERCAQAAWFESWLNPKRPAAGSDATAASDAGTIAHSILLEGKRDCMVVIDPRDHPNEKGGGFAQGWTNKSIKAARAAAIAAGKVPVMPGDGNEVERMVEAARAYLSMVREPAIRDIFEPDGGDSELTVVWDRDGVRYRLRADRISKDRKLIVDYKTVTRSAEPNSFARTIGSMGYDMSVAHYRDGIDATFGVLPTYVFFVQEQEPPYLCSLVALDPAYLEFAHMKVDRARRAWRACVKANHWPGYPDRVAYAELPPWEMTRDEEREAGRGGIPYDIDRLWEKPEAIDARAAARERS